MNSKTAKNIWAQSYQRHHKGGKLKLHSHSHSEHQIIVPLQGVAQLSVEKAGTYFLGPHQGIFIAAKSAHAAIFSGVLALDNLYIDTRLAPDDLAHQNFVFRLSELFMGLWASIQSQKCWTQKTPEFDALCLLLCQEMKSGRQNDAFLPMPKHPLLESMLLQLQENPASFSSANEIAAALNISSRHLRRIFRQACGITLTQWMARARLMLAKEMLSEKQKSSTIALELGFHEFASFSRFFKQKTGLSPRQWASSR